MINKSHSFSVSTYFKGTLISKEIHEILELDGI